MSNFTITRTAHLEAQASAVHAQIVDFHNWVRWSPWEGLDPNLQRTYSGPSSGVGAAYAWSGNGKAGQGSMRIVTDTPERVQVALDFLKPFKASNTVTFTLTPAGGGTDVAWTMTGVRGVIGRVFATVFRMDDYLAKDFDKGLEGLRRVTADDGGAADSRP